MVKCFISQETSSIDVSLHCCRDEKRCIDRDWHARRSSYSSLATISDLCWCRDRRPWYDVRECSNTIDDRSRLSYRDTDTRERKISCTIESTGKSREIRRSCRSRHDGKSCKSCRNIECDRDTREWYISSIGQGDCIFEYITDDAISSIDIDDAYRFRKKRDIEDK